MRSKGSTDEARLALSDLCAAYYEPVSKFIRERCESEDAASDLTQEFFARVLQRYGFDGADPERGRFRSFLLGAVKHFLAEQYHHGQRLKRGGGVIHESLDTAQEGDSTAPGLRLPDATTLTPDAAFDRHWAHVVLDRALAKLEADCAAEGKATHFAVLQPWLASGAETTQAEAAMELGMSETAVRVAIHRLRQRFRASLLAELAQTVAPGVSIEEELKHLLAALG